MRSLYLLSLVVCSFAVVFYLSSFHAGHSNKAANVLTAVQNYFHTALDQFEDAGENYHTTLLAYISHDTDITALRKAHLDTRLAFKKVAFLLEYNDPYAIKKSINGAPLPTVEPHVPEVQIIHPKGLQVLDEMVYEDEPDVAEISAQIRKLNKAIADISAYQKNISFQHRNILEATRLELIRIFTLGLTGFDTPGSLNAIPEAQTSLNSLRFVLLQYTPLLNEHHTNLAEALQKHFDAAHQFLLNESSFEELDRLAFLRQHFNPLMDLLWKVQTELGIETKKEITNLPQPLQSGATQLFSSDFFNTTYFRGFVDDEFINQKIELGRLLFYDPILSANNERSCASCHRPEAAFTDNRPKSLAYDGERSIQRNAPTLLNSIYTERFFYDLREPQLERQIKHVVFDENEFSTDFLTIIDKLGKSEEYRNRFAAAYPLAKISKYSISNAIAAYLGELKSFNSDFDRYARGETDELNEEVKRGFNLFMGKAACGTCHFAPTFSGLVPPYYQEGESEVLGVPIHPDSVILDSDYGRIASGRPIDEAPFYAFSFKTTTVRNIEKTAPYMHNGAFPDLESVLHFYNHGGGAGMGIELAYQTLAPDSLLLNSGEISDIIAFMNSLTDVSRADNIPTQLPAFEEQPEWNERVVGGSY